MNLTKLIIGVAPEQYYKFNNSMIQEITTSWSASECKWHETTRRRKYPSTAFGFACHHSDARQAETAAWMPPVCHGPGMMDSVHWIVKHQLTRSRRNHWMLLRCNRRDPHCGAVPFDHSVMDCPAQLASLDHSSMK